MNKDLDTQTVSHLTTTSTYENSEGGLDLSKLKNIIFRNYILIIGLGLLSGILGFVKILVTPPIYVANFELLSEPLNIETKVTSTNDKESTEAREQIGSVELNDVQLRILKSPQILSRTVDSLHNKYPGLNYGELIQDLNIQIISEEKSEEKILSVEYKNPNRQKVADVTNVLTQTYLDYSAEKRLRGLKRGIDFLDQQIPKVSLEVDNLQNQVNEFRKKHGFFDPKTGLKGMANRSEGLKNEREVIANRLRELQLISRNLERELKTQPIKSDVAIELDDSQYLELMNQLQELDLEIKRKSAIFTANSIEIQTLQQEKQQINTLVNEIRENLRQKLDKQIENLENRQQIVIKDLDDIKLQIAKWSKVNHDWYTLNQNLYFAVQKRDQFNIKKNDLQIDAAQQRTPWILITPAKEPTTNSISSINTLILSSSFGLLAGVAISFLLDSYKKIIYTSATVQNITNTPILSIIPYNPKSQQLSSFIKQLNLSQEVRQLLPQEEKLQEQKKSFWEVVPPSIETFRSFAANLGFLNLNTNLDGLDIDIDNNLKSIAITSAIPREGKSTVALNLSIATASMGKRVLLVDTDLRNSDGLSTSLGFESNQGLKDILKQDNPEDLGLNYIQQITLEENLFILPSGNNNPVTQYTGEIEINPSRLLASTKMYLLMEELKNHFDLVIYDLCAIIGLADVNLLATKTDGIVMVTGLGKIQAASLTQAIEQLSLCRAPVLGIVVNKLVNKGFE